MIGRTGRVKILLAFIVLIMLGSCSGNLIYTDVAVMPQSVWNLYNKAEFGFPVSDTTCRTNISFTVRTGSMYPFRNIFLFVTTYAPDGNSITDTLEYAIADEKGSWLGKGAGDIHELKLPYRQNVYFPEKGTYRFTIQHGMRVEDLRGVYDFGLRIEKHKQ